MSRAVAGIQAWVTMMMTKEFSPQTFSEHLLRPVWTYMVFVPSWALDGEKPGEGRSLQGTWKRVWARLERLGQPVRVTLLSPVVV